MLSPIELIQYTILEGCGRPMRLLRWIKDRPEIQVHLPESVKGIGAEKVVKWHTWGQQLDLHTSRGPGTMLGWKKHLGVYSSFFTQVPPITNLCSCDVVKEWACDIQQVTGLGAAKSNLDKFDSLDEMVMTKSQAMLTEITQAGLQRNLAHDQIRIIHVKDTSDYFAKYMWVKGLYLINDGGAHHFAAARLIAARIGTPVPLKGKLRTYTISKKEVNDLLAQYDVYAIPSDPSISGEFHDAMRTFEATYLRKEMPKPITDCEAIFLPKAEKRSMRVSRALQEAGVTNVGEHLISLLKLQQQHSEKQ